MTDTYRVTKTQIDESGAQHRVVQTGLSDGDAEVYIEQAGRRHAATGAEVMGSPTLTYLAMRRDDITVAYTVEVE